MISVLAVTLIITYYSVHIVLKCYHQVQVQVMQSVSWSQGLTGVQCSARARARPESWQDKGSVIVSN